MMTAYLIMVNTTPGRSPRHLARGALEHTSHYETCERNQKCKINVLDQIRSPFLSLRVISFVCDLLVPESRRPPKFDPIRIPGALPRFKSNDVASFFRTVQHPIIQTPLSKFDPSAHGHIWSETYCSYLKRAIITTLLFP
jgi:hypothetical protein